MTKIPFLDLRVTDDLERREIIDAVYRLMSHGRILLGPEVQELETQVASRMGRKYAVGCNSGTDSLIIALKALRIGAGDEVIVPALSFIATANAVSLVGATPIFADLGDDLNISVGAVETLITPATKAIIPVHWAGLPCDMASLTALAEQYGLDIIEDGSQAFDATYSGRKVGSFGKIGCYSMNSMKGLASLGEAGMLVCDDPNIYDRCVSLRYHGLVNREYCVDLAQNSRLDTIQAAILLVRLRRLDALIKRRRSNAAALSSEIRKYVKVPEDTNQAHHVYYTYTIQANRRDELRTHLSELGIETKIQHPLLMPQHPIYAGRAKGSWANADKLIKDVLCLPANEKLTAVQINQISKAVALFYHN